MRRLSLLGAGLGVLFLVACSDLVEPPADGGGLEVQEPRSSHIGSPALAAKLLASDGAADDWFGDDVALDGDIAVVGAYRDDHAGLDSGSAYVFERSGGTWTETAKLTVPSPNGGEYFGNAVAVDGEVIVVSARGTGSAHVFERVAGAWVKTAQLTASDGSSGAGIGSDIALDQDVIVVGAAGDDHAGASSGSAYVFERSGGTWSETAKLTASDPAPHDLFGASVSVSDGIALIGAYSKDERALDSGVAYVFESVAGSWSQTAKLAPSDGARLNNFGYSVAVRGSIALVGAHYDDDAGSTAGSVYVYEATGAGWSQTAKLVASNPTPGAQFGDDVALYDDVAVISAPHEDLVPGPSGYLFAGAVYLFERDGGTWTQSARRTAPDADLYDEFGKAVDVSQDAFMAGAPLDDDNGSRSGSAYVFEFTTPTPTNQPPTADAGPDQTVECADADDGTTTVTLDGTGSSDSDGSIASYEWSNGGSMIATGANPDVELSHGTYTVTLTVTDDDDDADTDDVEIDIVDTTAPSIDFTLDETTLWPPNHQMVTVATGIGATDLCDPDPTVDVAVTSNESVNGLGDGDTAPDWVVTDNGDGTFDVAVRAERAGTGTDRVYTIEVTATDAAGNSGMASGQVTVSQNQGRKGGPRR